MLTPEGYLVEEHSGRPARARACRGRAASCTAETRLRDLVDVVDEARDDDRIQALVLDLQGLEGAGLPMLQDLAQSIRWFRESGKKVYAYAESYSQRQYFLAAQADEVYLDPMGYVLLEGFGYFRTYFRGTLDKLAVDVNVFKAGTHKSRAGRMDADRHVGGGPRGRRIWVGALWDAYKTDVGAARKLEPGADPGLRRRGGGGRFARPAATSRSTRSRAAWWTRSRRATSSRRSSRKSSARTRRTASPRSTGRATCPTCAPSTAMREFGDQAVGVIVASGEILDGEHAPGLVGGDSLAKVLRNAREDDDLAAVVLRIDSPGGSIMASEVIRREVAALRAAGKPVVASMSTVAASGGYYIAMDADRIYAAPTTITGSIGVFAVVPTFQRTLGKVGVTSDGFGTTRLAGQTRPLPRAGARGEGDPAGFGRAPLPLLRRARRDGAQAPDRGDRQPRPGPRVDRARTRKAAGIVDELGGIDDAIADGGRARRPRRGIRRALDGAGALLARRAGHAPARRRGLGGRCRRAAPRVLPQVGFALERARALLALAAAGRPVYLCSCRVE